MSRASDAKDDIQRVLLDWLNRIPYRVKKLTLPVFLGRLPDPYVSCPDLSDVVRRVQLLPGRDLSEVVQQLPRPVPTPSSIVPFIMQEMNLPF